MPNREPLSCRSCGLPVAVTSGFGPLPNYCDAKCRGRAERLRLNPIRSETCAECGEKYETRLKSARFCRSKCRARFHTKQAAATWKILCG